MAELFAGGHLRFANGAWRDDNGDPVEIAEVVRCKDCNHFDKTPYGYECSLHSKKESEDYPAFAVDVRFSDFCSYGEKR